jgi:small subunit ribosomal protein S4
MARYIGPTCKLSRREGVDLMTKSALKPLSAKCKVDTPPGMHGSKRQRLSDYGKMLREKQKFRRRYGVLERQFRRYYKMAAAQKGSTGENLFKILESRLDNVVFRAGFASTVSEARQIISHKHILINDQVVNIPSYLVQPGDTVTVRNKAKSHARIQAAVALSEQRPEVDWISVDSKLLATQFNNYPTINDLPPEYVIQLVVELYSK